MHQSAFENCELLKFLCGGGDNSYGTPWIIILKDKTLISITTMTLKFGHFWTGLKYQNRIYIDNVSTIILP